MADVQVAPVDAVAPAAGQGDVQAVKKSSSKTSTKKAAAKKPSKPRKPSSQNLDHPKYVDMISAAIASLKERGGSSRQAILKYVIANYNVGKEVNMVNSRVKTALKSGVKNGKLKQAKGTGASGSFRLGEKPKTERKANKPKSKLAKVKKPDAVKAKKSTPKKKVAAKKAAKPKKSPAKKVVKAKKSPAKAKVKVAKKAKKSTPKKVAKKPAKPSKK